MGISDKYVKKNVTKPDILSFNRDFYLKFGFGRSKNDVCDGYVDWEGPKTGSKQHNFLSVCPSVEKNPSVAKRFVVFFGKTLGKMP